MKLRDEKQEKISDELKYAKLCIGIARRQMRSAAPGNALQTLVAVSQAIGRAKRVMRAEMKRCRRSP